MKIENSVLEVLSVAEVRGNSLRLVGSLARPMYLKVNKVIEAAGGKWDRKSKCHVFEGEAELRVEQMILTGNIDIPKDEFNFFPTPRDVVDMLIKESELRPGMTILEPSAGQGAIANVCAELGAEVDCFELMNANFNKLQQNPKLRLVTNADFMKQTPTVFYDRVIMNPPFLKRSDIKHVTHALTFLKTGGKLVSVMSAGVVFRSDKLTADFLDLVIERGGSIAALPEGAFKQSGTMVNTVIVSIPN